jgi:1-acyl-sn-glycerol-3-phosphate acyltransferase
MLRSAATARNLAGPLLRAAYPAQVWGAHHIPARGPMLIVGEHPEILAGALIKAAAPRPVHVIATTAVMQALPEAVLRAAGDIPNREPGIDAAEQALRILREGGAVVALGQSPAQGYLAAAGAVPIGTVIVLGAGGRVPTDPPALRRPVEIRFGPVSPIEVQGDPCAMSTIRATGELVRQRLVDARSEAVARHGGLDEEMR